MAFSLKYRAALMELAGRVVGKPRGWERIVRAAVPFESCRALTPRWIRREGFSFLANPPVPIGYNLMFFGTYEPEIRALMRKHLTPGCVAVDVGANVGWHTMLMASLVGEQGAVLACEANPSVRERLIEHLVANNLVNVDVVPFALGNKRDELHFIAPSRDSVGAGDGHIAAVTEDDSPDRISVQVVTLDEIIQERGLRRLDFIKVDVEGFEWRVFEGSQAVIARFRPVIVFEYNSIYAGRGAGDPDCLSRFFESLDYVVAMITQKGPQPISVNSWPDWANLLAMPREKVTAG